MQQKGTNQIQKRNQNTALVLRRIAESGSISRVDIATLTGLTKTTITNVVQALLDQGWVEEKDENNIESPSVMTSGRPAIQLRISAKKHLICGMLLKRNKTVVLVGTLSGEIIDQISYDHKESVDPDELVEILVSSYKEIRKKYNQSILGIGISCVGLINSAEGIILDPPLYFSRPCELPIVELLKNTIKEPIFLMHDAGASILAEQFYSQQKLPSHFAYLILNKGIGVGFVFNDQVFNGIMSQSGELGHCSIDTYGKQCICGNKGCLELYANIDVMTERLGEYKKIYENHPLMNKSDISFEDFVIYTNEKDVLCTTILREFLGYVSTSLVGIINLLDIDLIVIEYEGAVKGKYELERMLEEMINEKLLASHYKHVTIRQSRFGSHLSLVSPLAIVAQQVFEGNL